MQAIDIEHLSKTYAGGQKAVRDLSFTFGEGEVFGFLGPNGAGKTTTVKLLTGMLTPTSGRCRILGIDPAAQPEQVHALCGVLHLLLQGFEKGIVVAAQKIQGLAERTLVVLLGNIALTRGIALLDVII